MSPGGTVRTNGGGNGKKKKSCAIWDIVAVREGWRDLSEEGEDRCIGVL